MNYIDFRHKMDNFPVFETKELRLILGKKFSRSFLGNLKNWEEKGYLLKIKKGLYTLGDLKFSVSPLVLASKVYYPSYVSLESALGYYGIIPEAVFATTSVTTKKTKNFFSNEFGNFSYQKIKAEAFGGFETRKEKGISYNLAIPEKALADFFYLKRNILNGKKEQFESYRINEDFNFKKNKLLEFSESFKNKKTKFLIDNFIKYYVAR